MEAPPPPQLHQSCRGYNCKDIPDIVILAYEGCNTSRKWRDYIGKELEADGRKVGFQRLEEFSEMPLEEGLGKRCEETVYHCGMVIVLISNKFLQWIEKTKVVLGNGRQLF